MTRHYIRAYYNKYGRTVPVRYLEVQYIKFSVSPCHDPRLHVLPCGAPLTAHQIFLWRGGRRGHKGDVMRCDVMGWDGMGEMRCDVMWWGRVGGEECDVMMGWGRGE